MGKFVSVFFSMIILNSHGKMTELLSVEYHAQKRDFLKKNPLPVTVINACSDSDPRIRKTGIDAEMVSVKLLGGVV